MLSHPGKSVGVKTLLPTDALIDYFGHPVRHPKGKEANPWLAKFRLKQVGLELGDHSFFAVAPSPRKKVDERPKALHEAIVRLVVQGNGSTHQGRLACAGEVWMASVACHSLLRMRGPSLVEGQGSLPVATFLLQPPPLL